MQNGSFPNFPSDIHRTLSQFMASEGIPFESVRNPSFQKLLGLFGVDHKVFDVEELKNRVKWTKYRKRIAENGPISVTLDVTGAADGQSFLVFSVHFFEEFFERKCEIFFKKIDINDLNTLLITDKIGSPGVKISIFLCSGHKISEIFVNSSSSTTYICFYEYIDKFVSSILSDFSVKDAVNRVRVFLHKLNTNRKAFAMFQGIQRSKKRSTALPVLKNSTWHSISQFLEEWVNLHISFEESHHIWGQDVRSDETSLTLIRHIQKILKTCVDSVHEMSNEQSTISQVIPAVKRIEKAVFASQRTCRTVAVLRQTCANVFKPLLSGPNTGKYEIAMLLDPRFAWDPTIYHPDKWDRIQSMFMGQALLKTFTQSEMDFLGIHEQVDVDDRFAVFQNELTSYRTLLQSVAGSSRIQNPLMEFWRFYQTTLKFLAVMAKEYLGCPAIAIDAAYYFGESGGKFNRFYKRYEGFDDDAERFLNVASMEQEFRTRGFSEDVMGSSVAPDSEPLVKEEEEEEIPSTSQKIPYFKPLKYRLRSLPADFEDAETEPANKRTNMSVEDEERKPEHLLEPLEIPVKLEEPEDPPPKLSDRYKISMDTEETEGEIVLSDAWNVPELPPPAPKPPKPHVKYELRCFQCKQAGTVPKKQFKLPEDRILVLMTAVLHGRMKMSDAIQSYPIYHRFYCATHVQETCRFLMNDVFGVDDIDEIMTRPDELVEERVLKVFAAIQEVEMEEGAAHHIKDLTHKFIYKHSNDFHCILCPRRFHRLQMFIVSTSAGNLSRWITSGKIQHLDEASKYRKMKRLDMYKLFQTMTDRYVCKQHFHYPDKCTSAMSRLLAPERVLGEKEEEEEEEEEEDDKEEEEEEK